MSAFSKAIDNDENRIVALEDGSPIMRSAVTSSQGAEDGGIGCRSPVFLAGNILDC